MKRPTIKDVAARAGMSTLTVSRVLNAHPSIKDSTRARVEEAMRALSFEPNAAAQNMRRGSTRTIGFLMPDFAHGVSVVVAQNVERVLHRAGYTVMLACSHFDPETECAALRTFERNRVDAILLKTCDEHAPGIIARVKALSCPVILVDRDLPGEMTAVVSDHATAMRKAVDHLLDLGHRDIALIAPSTKMRPGRERVRGFVEAMADAGIEVPAGRILDGGNADGDAYAATHALMTADRPPTALIAAGNQILLGAIRALKALGKRYPDDVSLIGADYPSLGSVMTPTITMIDRVPSRLAEAAADRILSVLGPGDAAPRIEVLDSRFTVSDSCIPVEA